MDHTGVTTGVSHLVCVWHNGSFVIARRGYREGYPEGEGGLAILRFLTQLNIDRLRVGLHFITPNKNANNEYTNYDKNNEVLGAQILESVANAGIRSASVDVELDLSFANNWLQCGWAYVVDLDEHVLEVTEGVWTSSQEEKEGRFANARIHGQRLRATFEFAGLPSEAEFVKACYEGR